jgi:hypothetical protein
MPTAYTDPQQIDTYLMAELVAVEMFTRDAAMRKYHDMVLSKMLPITTARRSHMMTQAVVVQEWEAASD